MRKKTRSFIWGLILLFIGWVSIENKLDEGLDNFWDYVSISMSAILALIGVAKVQSTTG